MEVSVVDTIINVVDTDLIRVMQTLVDASNPTFSGRVRPGLLQDDPEDPPISVLTHTNDPENEGGWDNTIVNGPVSNYGMRVPAYELGGGQMWIYRFTTEIIAFLKPNTVRDLARRYSSIVLSRAMFTLKHVSFNVDPDSFGSYPLELKVIASDMVESGGDDQFIWRMHIKFQVLVYTP